MFEKFWRFIQLFEMVMRLRLYAFIPYGFVLIPCHLIFPWTLFSLGRKTTPEAVCAALKKLGPLFIKIGQLCSTRRDLFSAKWLTAFSQLQDSLPMEEPRFFQEVFQEALEVSLQQRIEVAWDRPLACASLAQVFPARLDRQKDIVVKILKPGIEIAIKRDLSLLQFFANIIAVVAPKRLALSSLVSQLSRTLALEIDFRYEQAHAYKIGATLTGATHIPFFYEEFTRKNILVMASFASYQKLQQLLDAPQSYPEQSRKVARNLLRFVISSIFRDGFFHADLHPGNIFICPQRADIVLIDFGQVGELPKREHFYLCQLVAALLEHDFNTIAEIFEQARWVPAKGFDRQRFERDLMVVFQPLIKAPLDAINISDTLAQLIQISRQHQLQIQSEFLLAQKVILMAEGIARQLDPALIPLKMFRADIAQAIKQRYGLRALPQHWKQQRWRLARFFLGIEEAPQENKVLFLGGAAMLNMIILISLGWALFLCYQPPAVIQAERAFILWHVLLFIGVINLWRKER